MADFKLLRHAHSAVKLDRLLAHGASGLADLRLRHRGKLCYVGGTLRQRSIQGSGRVANPTGRRRKICHEVGLAVDRIVLGSEIATLSPNDLADLAETAKVRLRMVEEKLDLPAQVLGFVQAMNMYDLDSMVSRFALDAIANDHMRHYAGREAIRAWLAKEIAGDRVTMFVTEIQRHSGGVAVLAKVTGDYDKTGLPDPLEIRFYFALAGDAIAQLVVIPAKRH